MYKWLVLGAIEFLESLDSAVKVAVVIHSFHLLQRKEKKKEEGLGKRLLLN